MEKNIKKSSFKTFRKIVFRTFLVLLLLLLCAGIALSLPSVQTKIAHYYTNKLNKKYGTDIYVDQVAVTIFGSIKLKKILIKDYKKDTLIYATRLNTSILDANKIINGDLILGTIRADGLVFNLKTYKKEKDSNFDKFLKVFETKKKSNSLFLMTSKKVIITQSHFILTDENTLANKEIDFTKLNGVFNNFKILGPEVNMDVDEMSFQDHHGLVVENLKTEFNYTKKNISLKKLDLITSNSSFKGSILLKYNRDNNDFSDFNNRVIFDITTDSAKIATNDIRFFYTDIAPNQNFNFKSKIDGTLNNLILKNLVLIDTKNSQIIGNVNFKNLFAKSGQGDFYMKGSFKKVASSYDNLTSLLPNVLRKKLPSSLKKLGRFTLIGDAEITTKTVDADFELKTILGNIKSQLLMTNLNNINDASYNGSIILDNFDVGSFLNRKDIGKVTLDIDVDGKGFTEKYLNTKFSGDIKSARYNGYTYQNINVDGSFKKPIFKGKINVNDPNLFLDFNGLVDLSKKENIYDFHAKVDYVNLKKLNFVNDSISVFKGDVLIKVAGNSVNNLRGDIVVTNASYQNPKDIYFFDKLNVSSKFDINNERVISIYSPNAIKGEISGKFDFTQIQKMVQNSLGSLYTNFKLDPLKKGQYLKFNFSEFNKIIEILNPKISVDSTATLTGSIKSDTNDFKMNFNSKKIDAFDNHLDNVRFEIDNKNPLYNTFVQIDSIKTKFYKARDFSLINVTSKDTLAFRVEFKGGEKGKDNFNLNLYHTINKDNKNIVGFSKSEVMLKDYLWFINEKNDDKNKLVFDKGFKNFTFDDIIISHENQSMQITGLLDGKRTKDLRLSFHDVDLNKVTPDIEKFKFNGRLNGDLYLKQNNSIYQPTAQLDIKELFINDNKLGDLNLDINGDESFKKFYIKSVIENENLKSFTADGNLQIEGEETLINLDLNFQKFNLGVLSNLGGDVISNIRGFVTGNASLTGKVSDIDYNGRLLADNVGLTIPYLNVDYIIDSNSIIDITKNKFSIPKTNITDSKYNTNASLEGFIKHKQFGNWELDLTIDSNRLLALNTKDHEDAAYFGTAFIKGGATLKGPTSGLTINVKAKSEKGTDIKIPINNAESSGDKNYIHFVTKNEKYKLGIPDPNLDKNYNGLEMNFDFEITPVATIEVILDRDSGHGMKGSGNGTLNLAINTGGKFEIYGDFQVWEGIYNFKYGGLIDKKFTVKKYGSIVWEGDPLRANLNLEAVYKTEANPDVLIGSNSFNKKIPVEVVIGVKGSLRNPEPDFNINFPNVNSVRKSEIEAKLGDKDARQTQALTLLATGSFLSQEGVGQTQPTNLLYEKASALFGDIFKSDNDKIQLNVDYVQGDKSALNQTNGRFGVTLSTKINDRITINGKVGVPVGGVSESAVVGNFEAQYRVNDDGTLNLRIFNRENDINYIGQGIGYTQGIGVSYEVDFDTFSELVNKIFKKNKLGKIEKPESDVEDSNPLPEGSKFIDKSEKDKKNQNKSDDELIHNKQAIPNEN